MTEWQKNSLMRKILPLLSIVLVFTTCEEIPPNNPPVISDLVIYPSQPKAGQLVVLTGIVDDEDGDNIRYEWIASGGTFLDSLGSNPIQWQAPTVADTIDIILYASDQDDVTSETRSFYLEPGLATVAGHVVDEATDHMLNGVVINLNGTEVTTGSDGYFLFTDVLAGDNIPISASAMNYVTYADFINVQVDENIIDISMTLLTEVGRIAGYITDSVTGEKLSGAIVQTGEVIDTTETDGYYELYNVPISENVPVRATLYGYDVFSSLIDVVAGYNTNDIALQPNIASVSGRVTSSSDASLLAGVIVTINQFVDTTNAAGFYEIADIPVTSNASFSASLDGYVTTYSTIQIIGGVNSLDVVLSDSPGTISGTVRDASDGSLITNAAIQVGQTTVTTNSIGYYYVEDLLPGSTEISCSITHYESFFEYVDIQPGSNSMDIDLTPATGVVSGFLRDSLQGVSLSEITITLDGLTTQSETDGSYLFEQVPEGQSLLSVSIPDFQDYSFVLDVNPGLNVHNILMQSATGTVLGVIQEAGTATALSGVLVVIGGDSSYTDESGYYEMASVALGAAQIICTFDHYIAYNEVITVGVGDNIVNVDLNANHGSLQGYIIDSEAGTRLDSVAVIINADTVFSDNQGYYEFMNIPLGLFSLEAQKQGYIDYSEWVDVTLGENILDISMTSNSGVLKGFIKDSVTGSVLDSAIVILESDTLMTGADGYYIFNQVTVGQRSSLQVQRTGYVSYAEWVDLTTGENIADVQLTPSN